MQAHRRTYDEERCEPTASAGTAEHVAHIGLGCKLRAQRSSPEFCAHRTHLAFFTLPPCPVRPFQSEGVADPQTVTNQEHLIVFQTHEALQASSHVGAGQTVYLQAVVVNDIVGLQECALDVGKERFPSAHAAPKEYDVSAKAAERRRFGVQLLRDNVDAA